VWQIDPEMAAQVGQGEPAVWRSHASRDEAEAESARQTGSSSLLRARSQASSRASRSPKAAETLKVVGDADIFALGDCAACPRPARERSVPPPPAGAITREALERKVPLRLVYNDDGSLISLSSSAIGDLMGNSFKSITVEGFFARLAYLFLSRRHRIAPHGPVPLMALANPLHRRPRPRLELH
jgi:NADH dehydrogenase FAD-containing subunit